MVKEQEKAFELGPMSVVLSQYLAEQAAQKGVELVTDFPDQTITLVGLEERLAQVFVNLITNAISFCSFGGTIRFWARQCEDRVLIVVEDTGPGLSDDSLLKIFDRFYSDRPASDFGNHSGLVSVQVGEGLYGQRILGRTRLHIFLLKRSKSYWYSPKRSVDAGQSIYASHHQFAALYG